MSLLRAADLEIFYVQVPVNFLSMHLVTLPCVNDASSTSLGSILHVWAVGGSARGIIG